MREGVDGCACAWGGPGVAGGGCEHTPGTVGHAAVVVVASHHARCPGPRVPVNEHRG